MDLFKDGMEDLVGVPVEEERGELAGPSVVQDSGSTHFLDKRMSLETAREIDKHLGMQDAVALALLITAISEKALKLCQELERQGKNAIRMSVDGRLNGILEIFWFSADKNNKNLIFEKQAYEVLYLTDNKRVLYDLGLEPDQASKLFDSQHSLPLYKRLLFDFCRQIIPEEQEKLTSLILAKTNSTARYQLMETQLLELMVSMSLDHRQCCQLLQDYIKELNYTHLDDYLTPQTDSILPQLAGSEYYEKGPGLCIIINQKNFTKNCSPNGPVLETRLGTDIDRDQLEITFTLLGATKIIIHNDLDSSSFISRLEDCQRLANEKRGEFAWFCLCVLSHGKRTKCGEDQVFATDCEGVSRKKIMQLFACATKSPNLQGIPKIFIFQACRAPEGDDPFHSGQPIQAGRVETDGVVATERVFPLSDYLVLSSTIEDHVTYRSTETGSFFIKYLCEELMRSGHTEDLISMVFRINGRMLDMKKYPSMSEVLGTFTKKFIFERTKQSMAKAAGLAYLHTAFKETLLSFVDERARRLSGLNTGQPN